MAKTINSNVAITDIDLSVIEKKRFRIDGDDNRILELNTSDLNIIARLKDSYPKLMNLTQEAVKKFPEDGIDPESIDLANPDTLVPITEFLSDIDTEMRELIDYIFDSNVSEVCAPSGSMYDPINGQFRFEHIIDCLSKLYESDIQGEAKQISTRIKKHTDKYTKKAVK